MIQNLLDINDLSKEKILFILDQASFFQKSNPTNLLQGKILANLFFEPSTRTKISFESAMLKLGGNVTGFADTKNTSIEKGEDFIDTIKVVQNYVDIIVIRHPKENSAKKAADIANIPIINAGDGSSQHPTQALLDLFTIQGTQKTLDNLHIGIFGDLKYGRAAHSLIDALSKFNNHLYIGYQEGLELPKPLYNRLKEKNISFSIHQKIEEVLSKLDILYMTRLQKERFAQEEKNTQTHLLKRDMLNGVKPNLKILHPLPRNHEIEKSIDNTPYAYYFTQAKNGLYVRQALLNIILNPKQSTNPLLTKSFL